MTIGVFDSGIGGMSIVRQLRAQYPFERIIYYGDTLRVPYGGKDPTELIHLAERITSFLIDQGATLIIDACNTTSALALDFLQHKYGDCAEIIGVLVPGAQKAAKLSRSRVGLMATQATVNSGVYQQNILALNERLEIHSTPCPLLVPFVESGELHSEKLIDVLGAYVIPLQKKAIDTLILGCTHYPFLEESIRQILGKDVNIVDPGREVITAIRDYSFTDTAESICYVSGDAADFREKADLLFPAHNFKHFITLDIMEQIDDERDKKKHRA